jgi:hypothetical protein
MQQDHPRATTAMVLGILGIVVCGVLAPIAMVMGRNALREIDASGGRLGGRGSAQAGWIMGLIGTIILAVSVVAIVAVIFLAAVSSSST